MWTWKINETPLLTSMDAPIVIRFMLYKDGVWQKELNSQVEIPQAEFEGMTEAQMDEHVKVRIREKMNLITQRIEKKFDRFANLKGLVFKAVDEGDDPVPKPVEPVPILEEPIK